MTSGASGSGTGSVGGGPDGGDLGVGGPAEERGDGPTQPPGVPEEVDPAQGPVHAAGEGLGARTGDLADPGAG